LPAGPPQHHAEAGHRIAQTMAALVAVRLMRRSWSCSNVQTGARTARFRFAAGTLRSGDRFLRRSSTVIRKLKSGGYRLYSSKKNPKTGKRRNLGTFASRAAAEKHERAVQFFKRH
jgi:hypothetical protein